MYVEAYRGSVPGYDFTIPNVEFLLDSSLETGKKKEIVFNIYIYIYMYILLKTSAFRKKKKNFVFSSGFAKQ